MNCSSPTKTIWLAKLYLGVTLSVLILLLLAGCNSGSKPSADKSSKNDTNQSVDQIVTSEELILDLTVQVSALAKSAKNLQLPDHQSETLFAQSVKINDWADSEKSSSAMEATPLSKLKIWPANLAEIAFFEHAKFYVIKGHFDEDSRDQFHSEVGFAALGKTNDQMWRSFEGHNDVTWKKSGDGKWQITEWKTNKLKQNDSPKLLFTEVLDRMVKDPAKRKALRTSQHMQYASQIFETGEVNLPNKELEQYFRIQQAGQHPGLAIVDFDNDGWDDIYICDEWRPNQMLRNVEGRELVDVAEKIGLNIDGPATSAVFLDVDNDGDQDAFIGCIYQECKLMINENGMYVDRTESNINVRLPKLTTSISAVDYNNDGLMDIYISTYGFPAGRKSSMSKFWIRDFMSNSEQLTMRSAQPNSHRFLNAIGPPNLLLKNIGDGKFTRSPVNSDVELHHNTFQATWSDYDMDGDADLYVSNDFAPDFLLRNDGIDGFVDVTLDAGGKDMMGFGMGASWADYDLDGDFDLYASNMYSKAGKRITKQVDGLDDRFFAMAEGNRLFINQDNRFTLVRNEAGDPTAGKAGWSWGGQFSDFNNDGREDLYVCSGFFTAPDKYASTKDL